MGMHIVYHDVARKAPETEKVLHATFCASLRELMGVADCVVLCTPALPTVAVAVAPSTATSLIHENDMAAARSVSVSASAPKEPKHKHKHKPKALICAESLGWLKPGARFVNIARGSLVDEEALADALESGLVSAAALDVHGDEPRVNPRLVRMAGMEIVESGASRMQDSLGGGQGGMRETERGVKNPGRVMLTCHNAGGTVETHIGFEELAMRNILAVLGGQEAITPVNMQYLERRVKSRL